MNAQLLSDFPGDALARAKHSNKPMPDREALLAKNSFPGPDNNRFIDAFMRKQRCSHEARGH